LHKLIITYLRARRAESAAPTVDNYLTEPSRNGLLNEGCRCSVLALRFVRQVFHGAPYSGRAPRGSFAKSISKIRTKARLPRPWLRRGSPDGVVLTVISKLPSLGGSAWLRAL